MFWNKTKEIVKPELVNVKKLIVTIIMADGSEEKTTLTGQALGDLAVVASKDIFRKWCINDGVVSLHHKDVSLCNVKEITYKTIDHFVEPED